MKRIIFFIIWLLFFFKLTYAIPLELLRCNIEKAQKQDALKVHIVDTKRKLDAHELFNYYKSK
ncbi:hypothetical protein ACFPDQ_03050 [Pseudofrancisella aestuarii]|uniref:Uncharacterized protein n=1 Tax=Pseudofrancisella aestuarii TaxID=2670347 RepID=A0ABV9TA70_9GAMM|nr:hypothetical protein [Pseudofrancisella aestuarii]